ncbi:MAG: serine hydrolase [Planctomycetota bacterium]|nr:serine hydrolase [Planctomycetota bacterium]
MSPHRTSNRPCDSYRAHRIERYLPRLFLHRIFLHRISRALRCLLLLFALGAGHTACGLRCHAQSLSDRIEPLIAKHAGKVCVAIKHLETGEAFLHRPQEVVPTASLIKFPVMIEYYRQVDAGMLSGDRMVTLTQEDKVPGSGILTDHFLNSTVLPLETINHLMITYSDNTATNLVLDQIGIANVAKTMQQLGLPETQIHSKVFRRDTSIAQDRSQKYGLGSTTAADMLSLLEQLHARKLVSQQASDRMMTHLLSCDDKTKLLRFLPKEVKGYHKTGAVNECRTDAGLFETPSGWIVMVCLTCENQDKSWGDSNAAEILCGRIAQETYEHFHPIPQDQFQSQELKLGANGPLVEALQLALNEKLSPTPNLSVDGDFGGMTEQAVARFRRENGLEEIGVVDASVWERLGEIELNPAPTQAIETLSELLPNDFSDGVPSVSCKAWALGDARTGKLLAGDRQDEPLDIASTTKMMTALLIAQEFQSDPSLLVQSITFSKRADQTPGSSSTVRAGESIRLKDAFYGLMLPSGNDASVALAEWYGQRKVAGERKLDPLNLFVDAMNEQASKLGMSHSTFRNPHGITHPEHKSSCVDLITLARELMKFPFVMEVVQTRRYSCLVKGQEGYTRRLSWTNSNQLLDRQGYLGFKTGTTDAAGACLVSLSHHQDTETIAVVLGSSGSAARYSDSRNLHRWSWTLDRK